MNVEGQIVITDVPGIIKMVISGDTINITWAHAVSTMNYGQLREFRDGIDEALSRMSPGDFVEQPAPEKTSWSDGDPEPTGVMRVLDRDGDVWILPAVGQKWTWNGHQYRWDTLVRLYGPVTRHDS